MTHWFKTLSDNTASSFHNFKTRLSHHFNPRLYTRQNFSSRHPTLQREQHASIHLINPKPVSSIDARYLSYSIDISVLAGGYWWEGSKLSRRGLGVLRIPPLNLKTKKLNRLVRALGPAYLRVGGSEADKLHYFQAPQASPDSLVLTREIWDQLHHFIRRHELKLAFTIKYGLFNRKQHGDWQDTEIAPLLEYTRQNGYHIDVCELGNELNAYWAFHGLRSQPRAKMLAQDYDTFSKLVKSYLPTTRVIGPGSAFWPRLGETIKPFSNITPRFLARCQQQSTTIDIVDWHYYPFQSDRTPIRTRAATLKHLLKPKSLNDYHKYALQMRNYRDRYFPNAELWTGETGSAQCGGQERLSDRFASCFWWADQLGLGALSGQSVMIRQSLIGGEYGLIDRLSLKPRPDYWLSWLWKSLMGTEVFEVDNQHHLLRCYCHSTPTDITQGGRTLLLINLSGKPISITQSGFSNLQRQYTLTAAKLSSKKLLINGRKPKFQKGEFTLSDFDCDRFETYLQPYSINFWLYS